MKASPDNKKSHATLFLRTQVNKECEKIPTTFVPLTPERINFNVNADVLVGLFHIMWSDMPRRRTYRLKLSDLVSEEGAYVGCRLFCGSVAINA